MLLCRLYVLSFFFQAEDGIRDLVRSRGLGDVYKRQVLVGVSLNPGVEQVFPPQGISLRWYYNLANRSGFVAALQPVSYTHLTLPTIYSV